MVCIDWGYVIRHVSKGARNFSVFGLNHGLSISNEKRSLSFSDGKNKYFHSIKYFSMQTTVIMKQEDLDKKVDVKEVASAASWAKLRFLPEKDQNIYVCKSKFALKFASNNRRNLISRFQWCNYCLLIIFH